MYLRKCNNVRFFSNTFEMVSLNNFKYYFYITPLNHNTNTKIRPDWVWLIAAAQLFWFMELSWCVRPSVSLAYLHFVPDKYELGFDSSIYNIKPGIAQIRLQS